MASASSTKPSGTVTELVKSASALTESSRKSLSPLSVHCFSGPIALNSREHRHSHQIHERLPVAVDSISVTGRNFSGPKAEGPSSFIGSRTASTVFESCMVRLPSLKLNMHAERFVGGRDFDLLRGRKTFPAPAF